MEKLTDTYAQKYTPDAMRAGFEQLGDPGAVPEWFEPVIAIVALLFSALALVIVTRRR